MIDVVNIADAAKTREISAAEFLLTLLRHPGVTLVNPLRY